jgi:hypothetical protein
MSSQFGFASRTTAESADLPGVPNRQPVRSRRQGGRPPPILPKERTDRAASGASRRGGLETRPARAWYLLLVIPFVALLCPVYLRQTPALAGIPFFYWYQFLWLFVTAGLTGTVYYAVRERDR